MKYKNIFKPRNDVGICKICNETKLLTEDHVPPKGCGNNGYISVNPEFASMFSDGGFHKKFQNGAKYKTICSRCNNEIGGDYDLHLIALVKAVETIVKSKLYLPRYVHLKINVVGVIKALYAHYLASSFFEDTVFDGLSRKYLKAQLATPPIQINCAFYPFTDTVIVKDFTKAWVLNNGTMPYVYMSTIKFFPLAFIFCEEPGAFGWSNINSLIGSSDINGSGILRLDRSVKCHAKWPEHPLTNEANMMNDIAQHGLRATKENAANK